MGEILDIIFSASFWAASLRLLTANIWGVRCADLRKIWRAKFGD